MRKKLRLLVSLCALSGFWSLANAQSVGDVVQGLDSKVYKLVDATDIISNGSFNEAIGEDNIIPGWYTNSDVEEVQMTTKYFGISSTGGAVDDGPYLMAKGNAGSKDVQSIRTGWKLDANQSYVMSIWSKKAGDWSKLFLSANAVSTTDEIKQIPNSDSWTQTMIGFTVTEEKPYLVLNCAWLGKIACFDEAVLWKAEEVANTDLLLKTIAEADLLDEVVKLRIQTELANANNLKESTDISAVKEAIDALRQAIDENSAFDSAVKAIRAEIQKAEKLGVGESDVADIEAALADASTTVDDVNTMLNTLNVLEFNVAKANYPYATPLGAWTNPIGGGTTKGEHWSGDGNRTYFDKWNGSAATYTMSQTVMLPAGEYVLKAAGRSNASLTMYVDDLSALFPAKAGTGYGIDVDGNANFSADGTYANGAGRGWEWRFIPFTLDESKDVAISAVLEVNNSWGSISDIELFSKSSVYVENWKIAKVSAETTLADEEYAVVAGAVRAALQAEVAKEVPTGGEEEYEAATQALKDAEAAFKAALPTYQSFVSQIEIAKAISADVTEYEALLTSETATMDELSVALSELNVLQYNAVGENYTLDVTNLIGDVSAWNGDMVTASGQHWDGTGSSTYWEQSSSQWNSSAWSVYKETKATLPAGKYVLKFTGRASDGVSAYVSVNDEKVYLPSKGDDGFGVDVEGKANFSADGTYANNNLGRGWEWRFMPFELADEAEVAFKIYAEANTTHQWVSITSVGLSRMFSKSEAVDELSSLCGISDGLLQKPMDADIKTELSSACEKVNDYLLTSADEMTVEKYNEYIQLLNDNIASAQSSVKYYESVNSFLAKYSTIAESYSAADAYNEKVASIKTGYENGTLEENENIEADIRKIMQSSVASTIDNGDITGILVNPSFEEGTDANNNGWSTGKETTGSWDYKLVEENPADGNKALNAWANQIRYINVSQETMLPEGVYTLTAQVRTNVAPLEEGTSIKAIVGDKKYNSNYMTYNLPEGVAWNSKEAWQTLKVTFVVPTEQAVTIGIYSEGHNWDNNQAGWFQVDNFRLYVENSYTRSTVAGNYGTLCLPYAFDVNDCEGIENIYKVSEMTAENAVISSVDAVEAGQPCIFKANADEITVKMPERSVVAEPVADDYLVGTFNNISKLGEGTYVLSGDKFYYVDSDVKADAFRCYFKPLSSGIKNFGFIGDGDGTVGINDIENDADIKDAVIYDLTGRRVKSPVKGIYIVNGKKMVINNLK